MLFPFRNIVDARLFARTIDVPFSYKAAYMYPTADESANVDVTLRSTSSV
jgi:hypothetical protein